MTYVDVMEPTGARMAFISPQIEALLGYPYERFLADARLLVRPGPPGRPRLVWRKPRARLVIKASPSTRNTGCITSTVTGSGSRHLLARDGRGTIDVALQGFIDRRDAPGRRPNACSNRRSAGTGAWWKRSPR